MKTKRNQLFVEQKHSFFARKKLRFSFYFHYAFVRIPIEVTQHWHLVANSDMNIEYIFVKSISSSFVNSISQRTSQCKNGKMIIII